MDLDIMSICNYLLNDNNDNRYYIMIINNSRTLLVIVVHSRGTKQHIKDKPNDTCFQTVRS